MLISEIIIMRIIQKFSIFVLFSLCGFLYSCSNHNDLAYLDHADDYILVAQGAGETLEKAKLNAIAELSKNIVSSITVQSSSIEEFNKKMFETTYKTYSYIDSVGFFNNLLFFDYIKIDDHSYKVAVGLDKNSLIENIRYLDAQLIDDVIYKSAKEVRRVQAYKANFLLSLMLLAKENGIVYDNRTLDSLLEYIRLLQESIHADGSMRFSLHYLKEDLVDGVKLIVDGKSYPYDSVVYLSKGSHNYKFSLTDYMGIEEGFTINKGDELSKDIYLQKKLKEVLKLSFSLDNKANNLDIDAVTSSIKSMFLAHQVEFIPDADSDNVVRVVISPSNDLVKLGDMYSIALHIQFKLLYKGEYLGDEFMIRYLSADPQSSIPLEILSKEIEAKIIPLFTNFINNL